jgi:hypothetical protein
MSGYAVVIEAVDQRGQEHFHLSAGGVASEFLGLHPSSSGRYDYRR